MVKAHRARKTNQKVAVALSGLGGVSSIFLFLSSLQAVRVS
jgi:hypothetical protein